MQVPVLYLMVLKKFTVHLENIFVIFIKGFKLPGEASSSPKRKSGFQNTKVLHLYGIFSEGSFGLPGSGSRFRIQTHEFN
jgi:hypothetical protein